MCLKPFLHRLPDIHRGLRILFHGEEWKIVDFGSDFF